MTAEQEWRRKVEGRTICTRCGWRKADHPLAWVVLGVTMACWQFRGVS